jgi:hypothetical protein
MVLYGRIDPDLEKRFRIKVIEKYGSTKGSLAQALEEAIRRWLEENEGV